MQAINLSANDYRKAKSGYIYFAESSFQGLPVIKIGYTTKWNVQLRINELEKEYSLKFNLLFYVPGDIADEKAIHARFSDRNVPNFKDNRGNLKKELFWLASDLKIFVESLKPENDTKQSQKTEPEVYCIDGEYYDEEHGNSFGNSFLIPLGIVGLMIFGIAIAFSPSEPSNYGTEAIIERIESNR